MNTQVSKEGQEDSFENPVVQTEYAIFSTCNEIKELMNRFDNGINQEVFFQQVNEIVLAAARMDSLSKTLLTHIGK